ncbi:GNAT family N-acetyltransferase [Microlunatus parietis]|uniref:Ribosomal protein S18 acetylase RimI-like enzyme n=1 Tax=Microlunatus parietis TaxID=682979 RepID=A0A7Y9I5Z9_9ACTN|nr:GNAT family N-acetyltransferase [Microlunatus parietis]NYE70925.1 ribosomal protein S18 acetylase RimI-like enzyme [Microlunatus parietis]
MPVLRSLTTEDLDHLMIVQRAGAAAGLGHIFPQETHPFPEATIRDRWVREIGNSEIDCFAVVADGRLAGFAATRAGELLHFGTAVDTWGSGLAGQAHAELLDHLINKGHDSAWLRVFEENHRAVRFYEKYGWQRTKITSRTSFPPHPVLRRYEITLGS